MKLVAGEPASLDFALQKGMVRWNDLSGYQMGKLLPERKGRALFADCLSHCHGVGFLNVTRSDEAGWRRIFDRMRENMKYIAHYTDQESADIASYASTVFGLDSEPRSPAELPGYEEVRRGEFSDAAMKIVYVEYELPGACRVPWSAAPDNDGKIWIPCYGIANRIARLDPNTGEVQEFRAPHPGTAGIHSAVPAPDGTVWFSEQGANKLGKWDPRTQAITEYQAVYAPGKEGLNEGGNKHTVRIDPKGSVWASGFPLTRFHPQTGKFTYFSGVARSYSIDFDPEDNVWFTAIDEGKIGKVDAKTDQVTKWATPTPHSEPKRIQVDSEGVVWFGEFKGGKIGRFDPKTETFKEYPLPGPAPTPYALGLDKNNGIWYCSQDMDVIGRLDLKTGHVTEYPFPYSGIGMREFFLDSEGRVWWGSPANSKVGYIILPTGS